MSKPESHEFEGVLFTVGDEVEVIGVDGYGGFNKGDIVTIVGGFRTYGKKDEWIVALEARGHNWFNALRILRHTKISINQGREINTAEEIEAMTRPDYIKEHEHYKIFAEDKQYNNYTDEQFKIVTAIATVLFRRSKSSQIHKLMKNWIDACPKTNLKAFYEWADKTYSSAEIDAMDAEFDKV